MSRSLTTQSPTTSNTVPVVSNTGFNAGDLVYQKNGSVDPIPDNLVTTGSFNITGNANIMVGPNNSNVLSATGTGITGGFSLSGPNAAKLSNGNLVIVYVAYNGFGPFRPYFRIVDENYNEVVAPTVLGAITPANTGNIAVCALPAGGFAVAMGDGSQNVYVGVYTNTGTVTTALAQDSTLGTFASFTMAARSSGNGFVIVGNDSTSGNTRFKVYSDTGSQIIAVTTVASFNTGVNRPAIAVRSDNSFVVGVRTTASIYRYYVYSSTGTAGVNGAINSTYTTLASSPHFEMTAITSGANLDMVYFVFVEGTNSFIVRQTLSASNVLGTESPQATGFTASIKSLSSGGYAMAYNDDNNGNLIVRIYNSADSLVANPTVSGISIRYSSAYTQFTTIVDLASNIALVGSYGYLNFPSRMAVMAQIVKSTNLVRNFSTNSLVVGTASSGVNAYARSSSTPNAAFFASSTTTTLSKTINSGVVAYSAAVNGGSSINFIHNKVMQNGDIIVVYSTFSNTVGFNVYSSSGVLLNTYAVGTTFSTPFAKACVLSNGKLVISVATGGNNILYYVYSTSYALIQTGSHQTIAGVTANNPNNASYGYDISAMVNSRFVVGYSVGATSYYSVITDTLTNVETAGVTGSYPYGSSVSGLPNGGFTFCSRLANSATYANIYAPLTSTSYTAINGAQVGSDNFSNMGWLTNASTAQGMGLFICQSNSTAGVYSMDAGINSVLNQVYSIRTSTFGTVGMCTMPNGQVLSVWLDSPGGSYTAFLHNLNGSSSSYTSQSIGLNGTGSSASTPHTCVSPLFDTLYVLTFIDSSSKGYMQIQNFASQTYTTGITAGVTPTATAGFIPSQSNGYIFKGVATTAATAGGTGLVQNVGQAQLNSNYPAGTTYQSFDSTGTLVQGTKGTIVGRNVNMTGNS
jgi:hypothetical protein